MRARQHTTRDYMTISVFNVKGEIFEEILHDRLAWMAKELKLFRENQHGFREGKLRGSENCNAISFETNRSKYG